MDASLTSGTNKHDKPLQLIQPRTESLLMAKVRESSLVFIVLWSGR